MTQKKATETLPITPMPLVLHSIYNAPSQVIGTNHVVVNDNTREGNCVGTATIREVSCILCRAQVPDSTWQAHLQWHNNEHQNEMSLTNTINDQALAIERLVAAVKELQNIVNTPPETKVLKRKPQEKFEDGAMYVRQGGQFVKIGVNNAPPPISTSQGLFQHLNGQQSVVAASLGESVKEYIDRHSKTVHVVPGKTPASERREIDTHRDFVVFAADMNHALQYEHRDIDGTLHRITCAHCNLLFNVNHNAERPGNTYGIWEITRCTG